MIRIIVDCREQNETLLNHLKNHGDVSVEIARLLLGDYLLPNLVVERKTFDDFCNSIKDGRFLKQAQNPANSRIQPLIILEIGPNSLNHRHVSIEAMQGALISASILYSIPVIRSRSPQETVRLMLQAYDQIRRFGVKVKCWKRPKPKQRFLDRTKKFQIHILQGFPGIGDIRANELLRRFGSIRSIVNATSEQLTAIGGIPPSLAEKIVQLIN